MLLISLQQGLAKTKSIYDPISINYLYPIKPEPVLPAFDDSLGYHSLDFSFNLVHKDSFIPGMGRGAWLTLGGGLDYGYMWNLYDSDNYIGYSVGFQYLGLSSNKGNGLNVDSYSALIPTKLKIKHDFYGITLGANIGAGYGFGINSKNTASNITFYNNIMPLAGGEIDFRLSKSAHVMVQYDHYFKVFGGENYITRGGFPSVNILSLGVRYAF